MAKTKVHIGFVLDETGSMDSRRDETIAAYNGFLTELRQEATKRGQKYRMTLLPFNSGAREFRYMGTALEDVPALSRETYHPENMTPLFDAIAQTIRQVESDLKKNEQVLLIIQTDGEENASREVASVEAIRHMIADRKAGGWDVIYLGQDEAAWGGGEQLGLPVEDSLNYAAPMAMSAFAGVARGAVKRYAGESRSVLAQQPDED